MDKETILNDVDVSEGLQLEDAVNESAVVKWVVNSLGELGVHVDGEYYFLYKGASIVYENDDKLLSVRPVGKIEFGESCYPINTRGPGKYGEVSLDDSPDWRPLPSSTLPEAV